MAVVFDLVGAFAAGDGAGDGVVVEDPAEGELGEAGAGGDQFAEFFDGGEAGFVIDPGEGFADIELLAVAVEVAMVVGGELRSLG